MLFNEAEAKDFVRTVFVLPFKFHWDIMQTEKMEILEANRQRKIVHASFLDSKVGTFVMHLAQKGYAFLAAPFMDAYYPDFGHLVHLFDHAIPNSDYDPIGSLCLMAMPLVAKVVPIEYDFGPLIEQLKAEQYYSLIFQDDYFELFGEGTILDSLTDDLELDAEWLNNPTPTSDG